MTEKQKTGTTTVGIKCKDGVVFVADKRATAGNLIVNKSTKKIVEITPQIAVTTAGSVSDLQQLIKLLKAQVRMKSLQTGRPVNAEESAHLLSGMAYSTIRRFYPGVTHFLLAGTKQDEYKLFDIFPDGSITDIEDYVASGSGSVFAYGVLETNFKEGLSVKEGIKLGVQAVNAALQRDAASGNGLDVVKITKEGVEHVMEKKIESVITV